MGSDRKSKNPTAKPTDKNHDLTSPSNDVEQSEPKDPSPNTEKSTEESSRNTPADSNEDDAAAKARQRQERFKALQSRAVCVTHSLISPDHWQIQVPVNYSVAWKLT